MVIEEFRKKLQQNGYCKFENVIQKELLDKLRDQIDEGIEVDRKNNQSRGNYSYVAQNKGQAFVDLLELSPLQKYIDDVISPTCILHSYNTISLKKDVSNKIQNAIHRDSPRFCTPYLLSVQILYMIDDFTKQNGATYILKGSHLSEERPSEDYFYKNAIQLEGKAGDAVIFDSMLWHAGGTNNTDNARRGITKVFTRSFMKQQIDYTKITKKEIIEKLSERGLRLLGFNVRVPESLEQFLLPQEQRLYKPNQG